MSSEPRGFYKDDCIQNFHKTRLAQLHEKGLISCPTADLSKQENHKNLLCFPSAVIELKHHDVKMKDTEYCYCQAANASSAAAAMLSQLSSYPRASISPLIVRPVVSFTFVGYRSKVWITYISSRKRERQRVVCNYVSDHLWWHSTPNRLI